MNWGLSARSPQRIDFSCYINQPSEQLVSALGLLGVPGLVNKRDRRPLRHAQGRCHYEGEPDQTRNELHAFPPLRHAPHTCRTMVVLYTGVSCGATFRTACAPECAWALGLRGDGPQTQLISGHVRREVNGADHLGIASLIERRKVLSTLYR